MAGNAPILAATALLAAACATPPPEAPFVHTIAPDAPPAMRECLEKPAVRDYFGRVHRRVMDSWALPEGIAAEREVEVRLWVGNEGDLLQADLVSSTSTVLEESALEAVYEAAPFPPPPEDALCVTRFPLIARFQNPESASLAASGTPPEGDDYIRLVAYVGPLGNTYLMHWPARKMPLAVYLPPPPEGLFEDPDAVFDAVRRGVLDWTDVASPGVPSFRFVESHADADIPVIWAEEPSGDWYIAFCSAQVRPPSLFDVEQILVTGRWQDGRVAEPDEIHEVVLHEMGHALGFAGHSDDPRDVMYPSMQQERGPGFSDRDRNTLRELYSRGNRPIRARRARQR